jgi:hypothetical protein
MTPERVVWLLATLVALAGSLLTHWPRDLRRRDQWVQAATGLAGAVLVVGLLWRVITTATWPGATLTERLALLGMGALVTFSWWSVHAQRHGGPVTRRGAAALLAAAAVLGIAAALAAEGAAVEAGPWAGLTWLPGLGQVAAGVGLGGLLAAFALSAAAQRAPIPPAEAELPPGLSAVRGPALDAGRGAALFCYPWLIAAVLLTAGWNLAAYATVWRGARGELWLLAAWLLAAAYLHLTSSWRPLRLPTWLPTLVAALAFAAAFAATITGGGA